MHGYVGALVVAVLTGTAASNAGAQATCGAQAAGTATCSPAGVNVTTTVTKIVRITVTPASASLSAPLEADFDGAGLASKTDLNLHAIVVRANVPWDLTLQGAAWTAPYAKPIADIEWTSNGGGAWTSMSAAAVSVLTGTATAGASVNVGYRTAWSLATDAPGAYTMPLTLTISSS